MALDGIFLYSIVNELRNELLRGKVDKINQPEKDEIVISIRNGRLTHKLLISASATYPKIHLTTLNKPNPLTAPMFCMLLRKYLNNAKIIDIRQVETDRIVIIDFESLDEMGFDSVYSLIVEIMGRHSNISLVRQRDNIIMESIKHVTPEINTIRCLYPGIKFVFPPKSEKLNPLNFDYKDLENFIPNNDLSFDSTIFSKLFTGVSSQYSKELVLNYNPDNDSVIHLDRIYEIALDAFSNVKALKFDFKVFFQNNLIKDFYCMHLSYMGEFKSKEYNSPSALIQDFYYEKDKQDRLNSKSSDLQRLITTNIDRCSKKIKILENTLIESENKDIFKIYGELLTANIYSLVQGDKLAHVMNYYSEKEEYIDIKLDENKSPSENIQRYFKKYTKLKKSEEAAEFQLKGAEEELAYLQSVLTNIKNADTYEEIEEIRKELKDTGYIRTKKSERNKKEKASKPMHFVSSDGIDIYVGKNNIQNDYLTLKFADKHDLWMHTKNIPGSHVIIKKYGEIPEKTLQEAATLAAYYSKSRESTKVPVDYTEIKNVRKPSGSKPGMVIYYTNKTIFIDPRSPEELQIKK